jgi:hypothetical protein
MARIFDPRPKVPENPAVSDEIDYPAGPLEATSLAAFLRRSGS